MFSMRVFLHRVIRFLKKNKFLFFDENIIYLNFIFKYANIFL